MELIVYTFLALFILAAIIFKISVTINPEPFEQIRSDIQQALNPQAKQSSTYPYERCPALLTDGELAFFQVLLPLLEAHWHISSKVRMEDIIRVKKGLDKKKAYGLRSRIKSRHIDFVLCDKKSLEILMCIELDDRSHNSARAKESDKFKNDALQAADVPLVRIPAKSNYTESYIKGFIFDEAEESEKQAV